ncbi:MAG: class I SAM-dependent methyltransferase [Burkholderiaceae bacterium]
MKPISNIAFYCCGIRMQDAAGENPLCGDVYAKLFMDEYGRGLCDKFAEETICSASMIVRHRIIDDILRQMLDSSPDLCIVIIGAGFDSRPYRLAGGNWFELDEPQLMAFKNERLPISECANPLQRIPIDFCTDSLREKLSAIAHSYTGEIVFILEGIFIYLDKNEIGKMLEILHSVFPKHQLICDLVNRQMVECYGQRLQEIIMEIGASFKAVDHPESIFLTNGYRVKKTISILEVSAELGINKTPKFILKYFCNGEIKGNSVYVLEKHDPYDDLAF